MEIVRTTRILQEKLAKRQELGTIGFVPTMGALHEGHLSLVRQSKKENPTTVVSIFVNPTQFNDKDDLKRYPRNLDQDANMLRQTGCDFIFAPSEDEMYPEPDTRKFDFGLLERVMEGAHRPGHFNGVGQIVSKLFDAVKPEKAYFGLKDFQQLAIIRKMVADYNYPVKIIACPIVREPDGLAMSSRNTLLSDEMRKAAPFIYQTLNKAKELAKSASFDQIRTFVVKEFDKQVLLKPEYFEIVDDTTLQAVTEAKPGRTYSACIAVFAGKIRLIDNVQLNS